MFPHNVIGILVSLIIYDIATCYLVSLLIFIYRGPFSHAPVETHQPIFMLLWICACFYLTFSNDLVERLVWASSWRMQPTSPWPSVLDKVMVKIMSLLSFCWCFPFSFLFFPFSVEVWYLTWAWVLLNVRLCWSSHIARLN